jgi:hypothetical protein
MIGRRGRRPSGRNSARLSFLLVFDLRRCLLGLLSPGTPQYPAERIVAFVTGIFVNRLVRRRPRVFAGPGPIPRGRVFNRETIEKRLVVNPR